MIGQTALGFEDIAHTEETLAYLRLTDASKKRTRKPGGRSKRVRSIRVSEPKRDEVDVRIATFQCYLLIAEEQFLEAIPLLEK